MVLLIEAAIGSYSLTFDQNRSLADKPERSFRHHNW